MKKLVKCAVCGKVFTPKVANGKYCGESCRRTGSRALRKEWEKRTGFLDKQRQNMRNYRDRITEAEREERADQARKEAVKREKEEKRQQYKAQASLIKAAKAGDPFARMELASQQSGNTSPEYWEAFKEIEIQYAAEAGEDSFTMVNGILVHDPDFGALVSKSIEDQGVIFIRADTKEKA